LLRQRHKNPKLYKQLVNRDLQLISEQALYQLFKADAPDFIEAAVSSSQQGAIWIPLD